MKDKVYQTVIALLLVTLLFAFYKLYSINQPHEITATQPKTKDLSKSIDIKKLKQEYRTNAQTQPTHSTRPDMRKKLKTKLTDFDASMQKSMQMIKEYNLKNPTRQIDLRIEPNDLIRRPIEVAERPITDALDSLKHKVHTLDNIPPSPDAKSPDSLSPQQSKNNAYTLSYSHSSSPHNSPANEERVREDQMIERITDQTRTPETDSNTGEQTAQDPDIQNYQNTINTITTVIEQINNNIQ
jgi:hypothetical protein